MNGLGHHACSHRHLQHGDKPTASQKLLWLHAGSASHAEGHGFLQGSSMRQNGIAAVYVEQLLPSGLLHGRFSFSATESVHSSLGSHQCTKPSLYDVPVGSVGRKRDLQQQRSILAHSLSVGKLFCRGLECCNMKHENIIPSAFFTTVMTSRVEPDANL